MKKVPFITLTVCATIFGTAVLAQKSMDVDTHVQGDKKIIKIRHGEALVDSRLNLTDEQKKEFKKPCGCFVTLTEHGELRGCIGVPYPSEPLADAIVEGCGVCEFEEFVCESQCNDQITFPPIPPKVNG